ncbi:MAG: hypothetical protein KC656_04100 [Myxococcales bacterium]|nr:hypothetical protein [Myxococcales bacterium]MCA9566996.1 hypothetical protein [Myxococcales bacterium]MCB9669838.1 RND transporter [Alphaproteobacteria bacterium]MCB9694562.1 RND transporter [Alphaproteobacteria bacterium]
MVEWIHQLPWGLLIFACLTLGLAPFAPPHIVEKLKMLREGTLKRPLDWFDLFYHALPFLLLAVKIGVEGWLALAG